MSFEFWTPAGESFKKATALINQSRERSLKFGIPYLDDCLIGILPTDVVVITGRSGGGKSEASAQIAMANIESGRVVYHFGLEEAPDEIGLRLGFRLMVKKHFEAGGRDKPNFMRWLYGGHDQQLLEPYRELAQAELDHKLKNYRPIYRGERFTIDDFEKNLIAAKADADLIILDHIHYMDLESENENAEHKAMLKKIRQLGIEYNVPIVLVAHIRKQGSRSKELIPSLEDIHGSSDIYKIATKVVILSAAKLQAVERGAEYRFPTFIHVAKCRHDGARTHYCGISIFNSVDGAYEQTYRVGRLSANAESWDEVDRASRPEWARG